MQTKIMLTLTVVVIAAATTATHPLLSTACRRLTTARIRSGSTAKAIHRSHEYVLNSDDALSGINSDRIQSSWMKAP
jgi:hypothetical protein